jgi:hypothetical protein
MSSIALGTASLNLVIRPGYNGLPTRNSSELQEWITQTARSSYQSAPPWKPVQLAAPTMSALLSVQG